jgi:hypothetical protein
MVEEWIYQFLIGSREVCALLLGFTGRIFGHYLFSPVVTFLNGVSKGSKIVQGLLTHKNSRIQLK